MVKAILKDHPGVANCENAYFTPLDLAVREGYIAIVKTLLEAGAAPTFRRGLSWKTDPLTKAEERGLTEIAALLEAAQQERFNASAVGEEICATVRNGETRKLQVLIAQNPASVNAADRDGNTPLHWAVQERRLRPIELLLANGADIHVENSKGRKPIHLAMGASHLQTPRRIVQKLLEHGADYDACVAAVLGDFDRVRELVMVDPTLANQANSANFRPVGYAARMGHAKIVKILLEYGVDPNAPEYDAPNGLALWVAVDGKHLDCVKILLEYGADPTAIVESSGSPIGRAISLKQTEMASLMYAHGATAGLAAYVFQDRIDVVGEILKANPALVNEGGDYGVLCMAAGFASVELIKLLLRYTPDLNRAWYSNNYMGYASRKNRRVVRGLMSSGFFLNMEPIRTTPTGLASPICTCRRKMVESRLPNCCLNSVQTSTPLTMNTTQRPSVGRRDGSRNRWSNSCWPMVQTRISPVKRGQSHWRGQRRKVTPKSLKSCEPTARQNLDRQPVQPLHAEKIGIQEAGHFRQVSGTLRS